jgi:hypothetical protein
VVIGVHLRLQFSNETLMATSRRNMKTGTPDNVRSCAGVQLNAPTPGTAGIEALTRLPAVLPA